MKNISVIIISAVVLTTFCFLAPDFAKTDDNSNLGTGNLSARQNGNQDIQDEGYGKDDEEYYNSQDDQASDEEASGQSNESTGNMEISSPQENSLTNAE